MNQPDEASAPHVAPAKASEPLRRRSSGSRRLIRTVALFLVVAVVSGVIGGASWDAAKWRWQAMTVVRTQDETYCTFADDSKIKADDDEFRVRTVDEPSYVPAVCTNKSTVEPGATITYGLRATNNGDADLDSFLITNHLPDGVTYLPGTSFATSDSEEIPLADDWFDTGTNLGGLKAGESKAIFFQVKVHNDVKDRQVLENTGQFQRLDQTSWMQCAVQTTVVVRLP